MLVRVEDVVVPAHRQRKDFGDIESLANSLATIGMISPIVVDESAEGLVLIAGERRLRAVKSLGWETVEAILKKDLQEDLRTLIELEENIRRKQLAWPEEIAAIKRYAMLAKVPSYEVAKHLGVSIVTLQSMLRVADALEENPKLGEISAWTACLRVIEAQNEKALSSALEDVFDEEELFPMEALEPEQAEGAKPLEQRIGPTFTPSTPNDPTRYEPIVRNGKTLLLQPDFHAEEKDFADWASTYSGRRFNFLHCDFPYGQNMGTQALQNSAARWDQEGGRYEDTPELFDRLCRAFFEKQDNFIADSAHCIFWLAHKNYGRLASRFVHYGWAVSEVGLVWHKSDNAGIAPDVRRWPRRTYEIAIFASRGDRKIVGVKGASYAGPTTKEHHLSEKPLEMLRHFFEMVVDSTTEILDPTCGSGTALRVAKALGAARGYGLDITPAHVEFTNRRLRDGN